MAGDIVALKATSTDMRRLYVQLKGVEGNLRVQLRRGIKTAAQPIVDAAKSNYSGWSPRLAGGVKVKPSFSGKSAGVYITNSLRGASPIEHGGNAGTFRHPVYGHRNSWATQAANPSFYRAGQQGEGAATAAIEQVMNDIIKGLAG